MPFAVPQSMQLLNQQDTHRYATLWKIERTDGEIFYFTDHDCVLEFEGNDYTPAGGFNASAREKQAGIRDHNVEVTGMLTSDAITEVDLRAGRYREAKVSEYLVDWRYPYSGYFSLNIYWLAETVYTGEYWKANVSGQPVWLKKEVGYLMSFDCRHRLGNAFGLDGVAGCKYDRESRRITRTVLSLVEPRRVFTLDPLPTDVQWVYGDATFTSGDNNGISQQIQDYNGSALAFELELPFNLQVGDTLSLVPGCDRKLSTCKVVYVQIENFGGFPFMPGTDRMIGGPIG